MGKNIGLGIGIVGCGSIALQNHLPGLALCPEVKVVALCDSNPGILRQALAQTGIVKGFEQYQELVALPQVDAVSLPPPPRPTLGALAAIAARKPPSAKTPRDDFTERCRVSSCEQAGVRHMTAFTYRFVPA